MVGDTNKESLNINNLICEKEETIFAEGDMIVPDSKPDILRPVNTSGNICVYKKELIDGKIKIDGSINTYIMYIADSSEDNIRGININLDFSNVIDAPNCKESMILDMTTTVRSIECNVINGRKINVKAAINVKFKVYTNKNIEIVNDVGENHNIQVLKNTAIVNSLVGYGDTKSYVKETVMIDNADNLAEILKVNVNLVDTDIKISYNKVLAKAEAEIKILYLTEDNRVVCSKNKIPIVGFIDIQDVSENNICDTSFEIRNMIIKPNSVEEHSIYVELEIQVLCMAYEEKELNLIEDLYSPLEVLNCNKKKIATVANKQKREENCKLSETVNIPELENSSIVDVDCKPIVTNVNKSNSRISYEGDLELDFILLESENQINTAIRKVPFEFVVDSIENGETLELDTNLEVGENDFVIKTGGDVVADINILFKIDMRNNENLNVIESIEVVENQEIEDYSLVIYIVKPGDTLWSIAKNLRSTVEDITKANAIEDENIIKVGEKLYIPRYVKYA